MSIEWRMNGPVTGEELTELFQHASWVRTRIPRQLERMLAGTGLWITARDEARLVGFGRAMCDGVLRGLIDDVVVLPEARGRGIGRQVVMRLLEHLRDVEEVMLTSAPDMERFYATLGFTRYAGLTMKKRRSSRVVALPPR